MRFRAKIVDAACLNHFTRVSSMVAKLAKTCALRLSPDKLHFILSDKLAGGGASLWCELRQEDFFSEFQMEGVSSDSNEIYLELTSENLARALKTAPNARALKVKLTNKHFPCLTVSVELVSMSSSSRIVTHDIPIKVIPRRLWRDFREPCIPDADVSIYLPVLKTMRSVVEKMKNISNHLVIEANLNGELNLKIETELVCVTTHFTDLGNPPLPSESASQDRSPEQMAEVRIDIKKLLQLLAGQQILCITGLFTLICFMKTSPSSISSRPCPSSVSPGRTGPVNAGTFVLTAEAVPGSPEVFVCPHCATDLPAVLTPSRWSV